MHVTAAQQLDGKHFLNEEYPGAATASSRLPPLRLRREAAPWKKDVRSEDERHYVLLTAVRVQD